MTKEEFIASYPENRRFTKIQLKGILDKVLNKTLGEVDKNHIFDITISNPKVTGIAGMVVEQSVLGYDKDSEQKADILIDGVPTEVKTTGIIKPKGKNKGTGVMYEAKEPVSVTAVSIDTIVPETFENSHFWEKLSHLLFVFYLYDSKDKKIVIASGYAKFPIMGYDLHQFSDDDKRRLKNDWQLIHDFIMDIQTNYQTEEDRKLQYPRLSSALRKDLMLIDTAPKYPNPPRFRLKRVFVSTIVNDYFTHGGLEKLKHPILKYAEIDAKCHVLTERYKGKTITEFYRIFGIESTPTGKGRGELIVVRMFGGHAQHLGDIEDFAKIGLVAKTITYMDGKKKEDMKLFPVDFKEWTDASTKFEDSELCSYFSDHSFIYVLFNHDPSKSSSEDTFVGFKRFSFSDDFIENDAKNVWERVRDLVINNKLRIIQEKDKDGNVIINKSGSIRESPNFPKSKESNVFFRGSATDSSDKNKKLVVNGLHMLEQYVWVRGSYVNEQLKALPYL